MNGEDPAGLAYAGNDFGPGYDGTSGSAYGQTTGGWGYNSDPGGSHDSGKADTLGGARRASDAGSKTLSAKRSLAERQRRAKTSIQESQEIEAYAKEQVEKDRQAREFQAHEENQRRAARLASGGNIVGKALKDGASWAATGALLGTAVPGVGTLGGSLAGGVAGFSSGLLKGTIKEAVDKSELSDSVKETWGLIDSVW